MGKNKHFRQFSQIPYAQRVQARRRAEIAAAREDAASRMLMGMMLALHETEGCGFVRLDRFGVHAVELIKEFYADRELCEDQLRRRLATLGIELERYAAAPPPSRRLGDVSQAEAQDAAMVAMLVGIVSCNDVLGLGADRLSRVTEATSRILMEYGHNAEAAAKYEEQLRSIGFVIVNGHVFKLEDADGKAVRNRGKD